MEPSDRRVQLILDTALLADRLAVAFYYTGLTTPVIIGDSRLAGASRDPNNPALPPGGNPSHVRYLQAALDAEVKHARLLTAAGARSDVTRLYAPASAFARLGSSLEPGSFLGMLDTIETVFVGMYTVAVDQLLRLRQLDLAVLTAGMAGIQAEHRMLGRAIAGLSPANNLTLEKEPFAAVDEARGALQPFVTGKGLTGAARLVKVPTDQQAARVIGKYGTHRVQNFL